MTTPARRQQLACFLAMGLVLGLQSLADAEDRTIAEGAEVQGDIVEVNIPALASGLASAFRDNWQGLRWAFQIHGLIAFIGFLALALLVIALPPSLSASFRPQGC